MPIPFNCPTCDVKIKAPDAAAGKQLSCPKCQARVRVPGDLIHFQPPPRPAPVAAREVPERPTRREEVVAHENLDDDRPRKRHRRRDEDSEDCEPVRKLRPAKSWKTVVAFFAAPAICVAIFVPIWMLTARQSPAPLPEKSSSDVVAPPPIAKPDPRPAYHDALKGEVMVGEIGVAITEVSVYKPSLPNRRGVDVESPEALTLVTVKVRNAMANRISGYSQWSPNRFGRSPEAARMRDNFGNLYEGFYRDREVKFPGENNNKRIEPGQSLTDCLVFFKPLRNVEYLEIRLPKGPVDFMDEAVTFRIPKGMIRFAE